METIRIGGLWDGKTKHQVGSVWDTKGLSPTIDTMLGGGQRTPHNGDLECQKYLHQQ